MDMLSGKAAEYGSRSDTSDYSNGAAAAHQCIERALQCVSARISDHSAFIDNSKELGLLATLPAAKKVLLHRHADVLAIAKSFIASGVDAAVLPAAATVEALSWDHTFRQYVGIKDHGMLGIYIDALKRSDNGEVHSKLMSLLLNLSYFMELKPLMLSEETGCREMLQDRMAKMDGPGASTILSIVTQLSYSDKGATWLLSDSPDMRAFREKMVDYVVGAASAGSDLQAKACTLLAQLVYRPTGSAWLLASERGLFKALVQLFDCGNSACVASVWQLYANMAHSTENRTLIFYSADLSLQQRAVAAVSGDNDRLKESAIRLLWGLAVERDIARSIVNSGSVLLPTLLRLARDEGGKTRFWICRLLVHLVSYGDDETTKELLGYEAHMLALDLIQLAGFDVSLKEEKKDNYVVHCLSFIMNLANHDVAIPILKACDPNPVHIMTSILQQQSSTGAESLKAMFTIAFLIGRDEHTLTVSDVLRSRPDTVQKMVDVLDVTLQGKHGTDYRFGVFRLELIIHACLAVSVSESNKAALAATPLVGLLKKVLDMFVRREGPVPAPKDSILSCGGGGADTLSAALAVETLLQLSFLYEENEDLQRNLMPPESELLRTIQDLVDSDRLPSVDSRRSASFLLSRLLPPGLPDPPCPPPAAGVSRTHVMLSYSWHEEARPLLVIAVEKELRRRGCDVWRDEVGSSLLPPMHGSTQDCMARAVELSSVVVVFVSKQYKESPNCRCECKYANQLRGREKLDIVFVMMQPEYTTSSHPNYCDGWLGLMIGDSFWLSLFDEQCIDGTTTEILSRVYAAERLRSQPALPLLDTVHSTFSGGNASTVRPVMASRQASANTDSTSLGASPGGVKSAEARRSHKAFTTIDTVPAVDLSTESFTLDNCRRIVLDTDETFVLGSLEGLVDSACVGASAIESAFDLLRVREYAIHNEEMVNLMRILGISTAVDLASLCKEDIELVSRYLKRAPRARFLALVERAAAAAAFPVTTPPATTTTTDDHATNNNNGGS